jgi:hypothetical protein
MLQAAELADVPARFSADGVAPARWKLTEKGGAPGERAKGCAYIPML